MMQKLNNLIIDGSAGKPILIDATFKANAHAKQVVVFCHGFKGFKDWGPFNKIANHFADNDIVFVKFNFSFNGTTTNDPVNFCDLKAFGNNNFCKELDDLSLVLDWIENCQELKGEINTSKISLFGHSRGGSIVMLKTAEDIRVKKVISWASPSNFLERLPKKEKLVKWKELGVAYIYNGRTKQNMPMYFQFYENCIKFAKRLNIQNAVSKMSIPHLLVHGNEDPTVLLSEAVNIKSWNPDIDLHIIDGANHVLGGFHPYALEKFPKDLQEAIDVTIKFLKG
ncbi:alpha/beta hydrolase [Flavobacteriales bacterium]|jgi:pimeloyl-ACP methyl ester carboxylesterase|nr:alpha/beta hydrolase [Flavobacteriales bacterium]